MSEANQTHSTYLDEITQWRQTMEDRLRAEDGWLTLVGLHWLHEGLNTLGSSPNASVPIPNVPDEIATIDLHDGKAFITAAAGVPLLIDGELRSAAPLNSDTAPEGPTIVSLKSVSFYIIERGNEYGVRVRDANSPTRLQFTQRNWFPADPSYKVTGHLVRHSPTRSLQVTNSANQTVGIDNPGRVSFEINGETYTLEAFLSTGNEIWFVFRDATSGESTYGGGRFLHATVGENNSVVLDFNKAYHPPCAFTPYATCPHPPKENTLPISIAVGEHH